MGRRVSPAVGGRLVLRMQLRSAWLRCGAETICTACGSTVCMVNRRVVDVLGESFRVVHTGSVDEKR